jgi:hypothetical protein
MRLEGSVAADSPPHDEELAPHPWTPAISQQERERARDHQLEDTPRCDDSALKTLAPQSSTRCDGGRDADSLSHA